MWTRWLASVDTDEEVEKYDLPGLKKALESKFGRAGVSFAIEGRSLRSSLEAGVAISNLEIKEIDDFVLRWAKPRGQVVQGDEPEADG